MEPFHRAFIALVLLALIMPALRRWADARGLSQAATAQASAYPARYRTLAQAMGHGDNLLLLRFIAATVVIFSHSYALSPIKSGHDPLTRLLDIYAGSVAVYLFFFISGFLVTGSWLRQASLGKFLWARARRVVPAYAVCVTLCALLLGARVSTLPLSTYFSSADTWHFVGWNLTFPESMQFALPGVLEDHRRTSINGSLWTLPAEVRAYTLLALFGLLGLIDRAPRLLLAISIGFALVIWGDYLLPLVSVKATLPMFGYFALGMLAWGWRQLLPLNPWIAAALIVATFLTRNQSAYPYLFALALCYSCLCFAYGLRALHGFNRFGDYSYGLYLWGFPMQQLVVHWLHNPSSTIITLIAWPLALGCAMLSWHGVEKPALSWRPRKKFATSAESTTQNNAAQNVTASGQARDIG